MHRVRGRRFECVPQGRGSGRRLQEDPSKVLDAIQELVHSAKDSPVRDARAALREAKALFESLKTDGGSRRRSLAEQVRSEKQGDSGIVMCIHVLCVGAWHCWRSAWCMKSVLSQRRSTGHRVHGKRGRAGRTQ